MLARHIMIGLALVLAVPGLAQAQYARGDLNCDGSINSLDIDPFVLALTSTPPGYPEYYAQYPSCDALLADTDCDGSLNSLDIDPFVQCLTGGCPPCPTEMVLDPRDSEFMMGNCMGNDPNEGWPDELPVHAVYGAVDALLHRHVYEVTNGAVLCVPQFRGLRGHIRALIERNHVESYTRTAAQISRIATRTPAATRTAWQVTGQTGSTVNYRRAVGDADHPMVAK